MKRVDGKKEGRIYLFGIQYYKMDDLRVEL